MCGLSGSGKTYHSQLLLRHLPDYVLLGPGLEREKQGLNYYSRKDTPRILAGIISQIEKNHQQNRGSILDANLKSTDLRQFFYDLAKHLDEEVIVVEHTCSDAVARQRMQQREQKSAAENPRDPKIYFNQKKVWQNPELDLELEENAHVSLIRFDTEKNESFLLRSSPASAQLINEIISYLKATDGL